MMKKDWTKAETEKALAMYRGGASAPTIAKKLGRSVPSVNNRLSGFRGRAPGFSDPAAGPTSQKSDDIRGDGRDVVWTTSTPVRTEADALAKAEIDTNVWQLDRCKINSWEMAAKNNDGEIVKTPLWQVELKLVRKRGYSPKELIAELVAALRQPKTAGGPRQLRKVDGVLAEVSIMDHHFGKLSWAPETGENYDLKIASERYRKAADVLVADAKAEKAQRILYVVGNDFYHVDNGANTTTAGTPQDCEGRWQKAFIAGATEARNAINLAREAAPVDVVVVKGNHDEERAFVLGVVLCAVYENDPRVKILNSPAMSVRYKWGSTLLGFQHGHNMRADRFKQLPNEMAHLWPDDWAATNWREWHLGHLHSESEDVWRYRASETIGDVIVRRLPSLCGTDRWHSNMGYRSLGAAECHFFDSRFGRVGYKTISQLALENF